MDDEDPYAVDMSEFYPADARPAKMMRADLEAAAAFAAADHDKRPLEITKDRWTDRSVPAETGQKDRRSWDVTWCAVFSSWTHRTISLYYQKTFRIE